MGAGRTGALCSTLGSLGRRTGGRRRKGDGGGGRHPGAAVPASGQGAGVECAALVCRSERCPRGACVGRGPRPLPGPGSPGAGQEDPRGDRV